MNNFITELSNHIAIEEIVLNANVLGILSSFEHELVKARPGITPRITGPEPARLLLLLAGSNETQKQGLSLAIARNYDRVCHQVHHNLFSQQFYDPAEADMIIVNAVIKGKIFIIPDAQLLFNKAAATQGNINLQTAKNAMHFVERLHHFRLPAILTLSSVSRLRKVVKNHALGTIVFN